MTIVISPKVELVITDVDTSVFNFATNKATRISVLRDITIERDSSFITTTVSKVSNTSNRVPSVINTGTGGTLLKFTTYLKPITDGANVSCAEKLLWESLSATDVADSAVDSDVTFTSGNLNKLRELFFYFILDDGSYYKVSRGVVNAVTIDIDIQGIATAQWEISAIDYLYSQTPTTGTYKDSTQQVYVRNKLSTIALQVTSPGPVVTTYDLALVEGNLEIRNKLVFTGRPRVGQLNVVDGHYVESRVATFSCKCYLNTKAQGSSSLQSALNLFSTFDEVNSLSNTTLSIGGANNDFRVDVQMPTSKIRLGAPTIGFINTIEVFLSPQESAVGAGDEIKLIYNN